MRESKYEYVFRFSRSCGIALIIYCYFLTALMKTVLNYNHFASTDTMLAGTNNMLMYSGQVKRVFCPDWLQERIESFCPPQTWMDKCYKMAKFTHEKA